MQKVNSALSLIHPTGEFTSFNNTAVITDSQKTSSYQLVETDGEYRAITQTSPHFSVGLFEPARNISNPQISSLEQALESVLEEQIRKDLAFIAADARGGRDTPSKGLTETAEYIKERLETEGWQPGASKDSFLYPYRLWRFGQFKVAPDDLLEGDTAIASNQEITGITVENNNQISQLKYGEDYFYTQLSENNDAEITGDIVGVGFGTEEYYEFVDVQDKWVVCVDSTSISPAERRELAKARGAKGVIVLPNPKESSTLLSKKLSHYSHLAQDGNLPIRFDNDLNEIYMTENGAQKFTPFLTEKNNIRPFLPHKTETTLTDKRILRKPFLATEADNVIGFWEGSDPELSKEVIIISAHYDHVGTKWGRIYNGADDNGSGTTLLLQMIEAIKILNPKRSVMLMWVSGEEKGLLGSAAWAKNPYFPEGYKPVANVNMDMVGRNDDSHINVTPTRRHKAYNGLTQIVERIHTEEGFETLGNADQYYYRSDHAEIAKLGIPVVFLTSGIHDDYHQPSDTVEKINYPKLASTTRLLLRLLAELQEDELDL